MFLTMFLKSLGLQMKFCWANGLFFLVIAGLSVSSMLSGCGKTGALYLPDDQVEKVEKVETQE
jgi:predicted small lipoprotein YifL